MEPNLREQFDRAVSNDPGADLGGLATAAMGEGRRIRRRRRHVIAAGAAVGLTMLAGVAGVQQFKASRDAPPSPSETVAAAMVPPAKSCSEQPVDRNATDAAIFLLPDVSEKQRRDLEQALSAEPNLAAFGYESREVAFERFKKLWKDSPDFVKSVTPDSLPESFLVRLKDPAGYEAFHATFSAKAGVDDIVGRRCPESASIGGVW